MEVPGNGWVEAEKESMGNNSKAAEIRQKLESSTTWNRYWQIHEAYGEEFSIPKLSAYAAEVEALRPLLQPLFPERTLASRLTAYLKNEISGREYFLSPRFGKQPRPNVWNDMADALVGLRAQFIIIIDFHALGIRDSFIAEFETQLEKSIERLTVSLDKAEAKGPEPDDVRPFIAPKSPPGKRPSKAAEIREFVKTVSDSLRSWKDTP
jgi:hypothetical protein